MDSGDLKTGKPSREAAALRDQLQRERALTSRLLFLGNSSNGLQDLLREATLLLSEWSECEAVGIRLHKGGDFPYFETRGFPREFVTAEDKLCVYDVEGRLARDVRGNPVLRCMCGLVAGGQFDPAKSYFTSRGSFWTNSTSGLLASNSAADGPMRACNRCHTEGYESVALIPLRSDGTVFGLLQMNDRRPGQFEAELIALVEGLAAALAEAMARRLAVQEARESHEQLRQQTERLRASEEHFKLLYQQAPLGYQSLDAEGRILEVNQTWLELLGYRCEDVLGRSFADFLVPAARPLFPERFGRFKRAGEVRGVEWEMVRGNGTLITVRFDGRIARDGRGGFLRTHCILHDTTQHRADEQRIAQMETRLNHASRLAMLGEMAGGIAHEINQPLCAIVNFAKACKNAASRDDVDRSQICEWSETIATAAARSGDIIRRLLRFGRMQSPTRETVTLEQLASDSLLLVRHAANSRKIAIQQDSGEAVVAVRVDPVQIQQVLVNLLRNAIEAVGNGPPGEGRVTVRWRALDAEVLVSVADNGPGLSGSDVQRMFEPFFTTKRQGLGLGLPISKTFIEEHGGRIWVLPNDDRGLTVSFTLPAAKDTGCHGSR